MTWKVVLIAALCGVMGGLVGAVVSPGLAYLLTQGTKPQDFEVYDQATLGPAIEQFLLSNPSVLQRVSVALQKEVEAAKRERNRTAIAALQDEIFDDPSSVVIGNPNGDVTLVEMYDYNCGFCRSSMPDIATLVAEDPQLRVVLRQFPVLSEGSVAAAQVGVVVAMMGGDYWLFHQALFTVRGQVNGEVAIRTAESLGLSADDLRAKVDGPEVSAVIEKTYAIARRLDISGTPTFIIGDEIIPGAVGLESLRERVENIRRCGSTTCDQPQNNSP